MTEQTKDRKIRTATEKAQDELDLATRKHDAVQKRVTKLKADYEKAEQQLKEAEAEKTFKASHPLLKSEPEPDLFDGPGDDEDDKA